MSTEKARKLHDGKTDWARIDRLGDADIEDMALADADNPPTSVAEWTNSFVGHPSPDRELDRWFDAEIIDWFEAQGTNYAERMNIVLRAYVDARRKAG